MTAAAAILLCLLASLGGGAALLRALGLDRSLSACERPVVAFAVGVGVLGWLVFFLALGGWVRPRDFVALGLVLSAGTLLLRSSVDPGRFRWPEWGWLAVAVLAVLALYVATALVAPADADTLAYHFARPKQILADGRLILVAKMVDGITPLLVQMTYLPALALGGEPALMMWVLLTGLAPAALGGVLASRWLPGGWAMAVVLAVLTVPAWVFGASGGQVETRLALMVLVSVLAVAEARRQPGWRWEVLAGLTAGFYAGGKTLGLLFVIAAGLALVVRRRPHLKGAAAFAVAAILAGGQWYLWHWQQTGDPVFPMLFDLLGLPDGPIWTKDHQALFKTMFFPTESPVPPGLGLALSYPVLATFGLGPSMWESGRTGLGPLFWVLLPFAVAGTWHCRRRIAASPLLPMTAALLLFYGLWILSGSSQRVRHLVPMVPAAILVVMVAAHRGAQALSTPGFLKMAAAATVAVQSAALVVFSAGYIRALATGESRDHFLERTVAGYPLARWLNGHLGPDDRVLIGERQVLYHLDVRYHYGNELLQAEIDLRRDGADPARRWAQLRRLGITHVVIDPAEPGQPAVSAWQQLSSDLIARQCARSLVRLEWQWSLSRSVPGLGQATQRAEILELSPETCGYER